MAEKLDDLRVFLLVAETGSFTKAAAQLGVSQSALSYSHPLKILHKEQR